MELMPKPPTRIGEPEHFVGSVYIDAYVRGEGASRLRVSTVRYAPGARNAWHTHVNGQTLYISEGIGRIQSRGSALVIMKAGDIIYTPAGEWHWHGADPDHFMAHLAMFDGAGDGQGEDAEWGPLVTDAEYLGLDS